MVGALADLGGTFTHWRTWWLMASQDINLRYRRSAIGPFWLSITMAAQVLGIGILFSQIMDQPLGPFLLYIAASLLLWGHLSSMINDGCAVLIEGAAHLRAVPIPAPVLAARMVHRNLIIFLHNVVVILALMLAVGARPTWALAMAPLGLLLVTLFGYFAAIGLSILCLRFRDMTQVVTNVMQVAFFVTPIIWQRGQGRVNNLLVDLNPLYHLIEVVRAPLLETWPTTLNWAVAGGCVVLAALFALVMLNIARRRIYLWL